MKNTNFEVLAFTKLSVIVTRNLYVSKAARIFEPNILSDFAALFKVVGTISPTRERRLTHINYR